MVRYRAQIAMFYDSLFPRDALVVTPCFQDNGVTSDPQGLADDLADGVAAKIPATQRVDVKLYDLEGTKPVFPAAVATRNPLGSSGSSNPRELAICLSFYADRNIPRHRGRLYIPAPVAAGSSLANRPSTAHMTNVAGWVPMLAGLGGADVDWVVWSQVDRTARKVSNWWVDDEWDVVRSRGLRPTTRQSGTTSG